MKSMKLAGALLLLASLGACGDDDGGGTTVEFRDFATSEIIAGTESTLVRTEEGISSTNHVTFYPEHEGLVVTYWYVIFDDPSQCESTPTCTSVDFFADLGEPSAIHFDGLIVDDTLEFDFEIERSVADGPADPADGDLIPAETAWGLTRPMTAEIHVIMRQHGTPLDDLETQMGSLNGGCPPNTCGNIFYAPHQAE